MKKLLLITILLLAFLLKPSMIFAQPMMGGSTEAASDGHTAREEAEGKEIWEKLQAKQLECKNLTDDNFDSLGEYFMGQSVGNTERHAAMNQMMKNMMGEQREAQMHIIMGKRFSGCEPAASYPNSGFDFMPMMFLLRQGYGGQGMMGSAGSPQVGGGGNPMMGYGWNKMMGGWGGFGILGWLTMLAFWLILILGVVALIRYLGSSRKRSDEDKSPLDILKERYAKGEIDKKEFEEMKKDLR